MDDELGRGLAALHAGHRSCLLVERGAVVLDEVPTAPLLLPGSFDPVHEGHLALAHAAVTAVAAAGLGHRRALLELSVRNVDKPTLDVAEVRRRLEGLRDAPPVLVTAAPRFVDKARLAPGAVFAVGHDTAARLVDPAYYDDADARDRALRSIAAAGCHVAVAGRAVDGDAYRDLADLDVPTAGRGLFLPVPGFRLDVSSTALRRGDDPG